MKLEASGKLKSFKFISIILVFAPVLDPYILTSNVGFDFRMMYAIAFLGVLVILYKTREIKIKYDLSVLILIFAALTCISFMIGIDNRNAFISYKNIMIWLILSGMVGILWASFNKRYFIKFSYIIGILSSIFLFIQYILLSLGYSGVIDGKIPFLNISEYDQWASLYNVNGAIRAHSIFQEPSYLAIFLLPLVAHSIESKKYISSLIFIISVILSTSSVGIAGILLILIFNFLRKSSKENNKRKIQLTISILFILVLIIGIYSGSKEIKISIDYSLDKIFSIQEDLGNERMGSTKLRLVGHSELFNEFPAFYKIFGIGANQYIEYFSLVLAYSSSIVTILLNFGILGVISFFSWAAYFYFAHSYKNSIYFILFLMVLFVDYMWFNWYFFYLLTWIIAVNSKKGV